jgi:hypothetical protein
LMGGIGHVFEYAARGIGEVNYKVEVEG